MKIKVKSSGEVYYDDCWENQDVRIDEAEIKGTIDWDAFRREAAKDILAGFAGSVMRDDDILEDKTVKDLVKTAVMWADELIKQLKEGQK